MKKEILVFGWTQSESDKENSGQEPLRNCQWWIILEQKNGPSQIQFYCTFYEDSWGKKESDKIFVMYSGVWNT